MAFCKASVDVDADLTIDRVVINSGSESVDFSNVHFPPFSVAKGDGPEPALCVDRGRKDSQPLKFVATPQLALGCNIIAWVRNKTPSGKFEATLVFKFIVDVFSDCARTCCVTWVVQDIRARIQIYAREQPTKPEVIDTGYKNLFNVISYGGCPAPDWRPCPCSRRFGLAFEIDKHPLNDKALLTLTGWANLDLVVYVGG